MTLTDITNQIIGELTNREFLDEQDLIDCIKVDKEFSSELPELISASLKELEDQGLIKKLGLKSKWILKQPLQASGQSVDISMETCNEIAEVINAFLDAQGNIGTRADKLNISEAEIAMILNILNNLMMQDPDEMDEDGNDE